MKWTPPWCSGVLLWSSGRCFIGDAKYTNKKGVSSLAKAWHGWSKCRSNPVGGVWDSPRGWAHFSKRHPWTLCAHFHYIALELQFFNVTLPEIHVHLTHAMCCDIIILLSKDFERSTDGTITNPRLLMETIFFATYRMKVAGEATLAKLQGQQRQNMICMSKAQQKSADDCLLTANANILPALSCLPGAVSGIPCYVLMMSCNFSTCSFTCFM